MWASPLRSTYPSPLGVLRVLGANLLVAPRRFTSPSPPPIANQPLARTAPAAHEQREPAEHRQGDRSCLRHRLDHKAGKGRPTPRIRHRIGQRGGIRNLHREVDKGVRGTGIESQRRGRVVPPAIRESLRAAAVGHPIAPVGMQELNLVSRPRAQPADR